MNDLARELEELAGRLRSGELDSDEAAAAEDAENADPGTEEE